MRLIELRLKNLNSLKGEWHIDFSNPAFVNEGIFAITGQTGAGKTTILDAICLALYSQTPRLGEITGTSNEMMTQGTGECSAEVEIEISGTHYRCVWSQHRAYKKAKGKLSSIKHEIYEAKTGVILEDAKSKTTPYIQALIGMDFNQFTRSIMLAQGGFAAFLKSDVGNRAAILEKITGTAIYAKISKDVFEKKRDEEGELAKLQAGSDSLPLLSSEDERQLVADLKSHQHSQDTQRQVLKTVADKIQWWDKTEALKQQLAHYQMAMTDAKQNEHTFIPDAARLDAANKALEMDSPFQELTYSRNTATRLDNEQQDLLGKIPLQKSVFDTATTELHAATTHVTQVADELNATLPIIAKVREIDAQIQQKTHSLTDDHQRKDILSANIQRLSQYINNHKAVKQDTEQQLASIAHYLSTHSEAIDLETDIVLFNNDCKRLNALLQNNVALSNDQLNHQNTACQLQRDIQALNRQQTAERLKIEEQRDLLKSLQQQQANLLQGSSLNNSRSQQEYIDNLSNQIEKFSFKWQQLTDISTQVATISAALPNIQQALSTLEQSIRDNESDIINAKDKRKEQQAYLDALQKVAKLENYIVELQDDSPCPLCGATEHPYHHQHPFLDNTAQNEPSLIQKTQQQLTNSDAIIDELAHSLSERQIDYATKQSTLTNEQDKLIPLRHQTKTLCATLQSDISALVTVEIDFAGAFADSMTAIIQPLSQVSDDLQRFNQQIDEPILDKNIVDKRASLLAITENVQTKLTQQKQGIKTTLTQYDDLTQTLTQISQALDIDEKAQQQYINDHHNLATDIKLNTQNIERLNQATATHFIELATVMATILAIVNKYPAGTYQDSLNAGFIDGTLPETLPETIESLSNSIQNKVVLNQQDIDVYMDRLQPLGTVLTQLKQQFHTQKNNQQTMQTTLNGITIQIEDKQSQLDVSEVELKNIVTLIADKTSTVEQLQHNRKVQFSNKNTEEEENRLRTDFDAAKVALAYQQRQRDNAKQVLLQLQERQQKLEDEFSAIITTLNAQENTFAALLAQSQFATETAFESARLAKEQRDILKQRQSTIDHALNHAKTQLNMIQHSLNEQLTNPLTTEHRDTLAAKHLQLQTDIDMRLGEIGAIEQQLKSNEQQKVAQAAQNIAIHAQKENMQVWQQLYDLIGSADGKKYRTFAQGLTFQVMIDHANKQLQKMSDRYLLIHDDINALELNVIDNYQGGDIRSTKNLSGGEGFIISLALALGLSQMASQNIRVDSLFLDEGFGTLDEESLDIALDTLTNLQQEGKLIGIISHVQALKERILTQIQVKKISGGFSEISGQGCHKIAS